jgi:hypothetical protein
MRRAEEQSRSAARRGRELARATWNETGHMLRRKMRVNPPNSDPKLQSPVPTGQPSRTKIVSINGKDVRTEETNSSGRRRA